jgi:hypothetical protein
MTRRQLIANLRAHLPLLLGTLRRAAVVVVAVAVATAATATTALATTVAVAAPAAEAEAAEVAAAAAAAAAPRAAAVLVALAEAEAAAAVARQEEVAATMATMATMASRPQNFRSADAKRRLSIALSTLFSACRSVTSLMPGGMAILHHACCQCSSSHRAGMLALFHVTVTHQRFQYRHIRLRRYPTPAYSYNAKLACDPNETDIVCKFTCQMIVCKWTWPFCFFITVQ